jgi:adenosylcobinamide-phosphate synthase
MSVALALLAMLIELCLGYPQFVLRAIGHPVTWTGRLIGALDRALNRETAAANARRAAGVAAVAILVAVVGAVAFLVQRELLRWPGGVLATALLASTLIAQRSLHRHVADVAVTLAQGDIGAARVAVSHIVGRDTAALDAAGVSRAAIESLAENFSDGIVAPVLWLAIAGLPGAALYKAINTADSMIGHRTPRYAAFGFAAARLDDLVNQPQAEALLRTEEAVAPGPDEAPPPSRVLVARARGERPRQPRIAVRDLQVADERVGDRADARDISLCRRDLSRRVHRRRSVAA